VKPAEVQILGLKVNKVTMADALAFIDAALKKDGLTRVITLNAENAYCSYGDKELTALINDADLVTPDGSGILWASTKYGEIIKERVCGVDLLTELFDKYSDGSYGFYFLGAKPEVARLAAEKIRKSYPRLKYCGYHHGYFNRENSESIADHIADSGADILIAAMGAPFQDCWIAEYGERCKVKVGIGVGGSLDVIAGVVNRAPDFFQKTRLEWLYRVFKEPSRIRRTMVLPKFIRLVRKDRNLQ
jgi:N-acetylglucosaminyldiphosphoundecaprenol N-acetyl-beta-D-mannosaminyltransferase